MAVLGLRFCARAFSSCGERGPLFIAVRGPLTVTASLAAEHRLQTRRLSSCGSRAQLLRGMWDLPRPGLEPISPALAGRFSTTAPPGKPPSLLLAPPEFSWLVFSGSVPYRDLLLWDNSCKWLLLCLAEAGSFGQQIFLYWTFYIKGIIGYVAFYDWIFFT